MEAINAIGRRKAAVARVYLHDGKGKITINGRDYKEYFGTETLHYMVTQPLLVVNAAVLKGRLKLFAWVLQEPW
jgi:small subunit ribosomal protein S9